LARFEETLGRRLFERTREGLIATHAATRMLPAAEEMERGLKHLAATAGSIHADLEGVVRIACPPGLADTFLVPMLAELRRRHPALAFEIDAGVRPVDLARHEADLALRSIRPDSAELIQMKLLSSRSILVASPELAAKLSPVRDWTALPWIFWGHDLDHIPIPRWCAKHARGVVPVLRTSAMGAQLRAAQLGMGVAFVPEHYAPVAGLVPLEISRKLSADAASWPVDDLYLVCHRSVRNAPRVAAVWDHLIASFRAAPT
jgi:DNA-binding transcriptional LysR family regulator